MMTDWTPIIVGLLIVIAAVVLIRRWPDSDVARELLRPYGIQPTGPRGIRTRRDHLRSALLAGGTATALLTTVIAVASFAGRLPIDQLSGRASNGYVFIAFLLGVVTALVALQALWKAVIWHEELPDLPEHRTALADALDQLIDGQIDPATRSSYLEVRYVNRELEQIRRATLKLVAQHKGTLPPSYRQQLREWTTAIRRTAGPPKS
jgi:hypothetical protein